MALAATEKAKVCASGRPKYRSVVNTRSGLSATRRLLAAVFGIAAIVAEMTSPAVDRKLAEVDARQVMGWDLPNAEFLNIIPKFACTEICSVRGPWRNVQEFGLMFLYFLVQLSAEVHGCRVLARTRQRP
jgi:hypothetical protein